MQERTMRRRARLTVSSDVPAAGPVVVAAVFWLFASLNSAMNSVIAGRARAVAEGWCCRRSLYGTGPAANLYASGRTLSSAPGPLQSELKEFRPTESVSRDETAASTRSARAAINRGELPRARI